MTPEQRYLLLLLQHALRGTKADVFPEDLDGDALLTECRQQGVRALSCFAVSQDILPPELRDRWSRAAFQDAAAYYKICAAHVEVCRLLESNGIPTVILKGCASARYYPHPEYRAMGDVDFYVSPDDIEKSRALLEANGYSDDHSIGDHDWSFHKDGIHFELHFSVSGIPSGAEGDPFRRALADLIKDRRQFETPLGVISVPSELHHGLIILLHTASHLLGGGLGLRHLCDWTAFLGHFSDDEFCSLFEDVFRSLQVWQFSQVLTLACEKYLGLPEHAWTRGVDEAAAGLLMNEFLTRGNFGEKGGQRQSDLMLSEGFSVRLGKKTGLPTLLGILRKTTLRQWPITARYSLLLPFGMLCCSLRYTVRMLLGRREKLDLIAMSREAAERKALFAAFGLVDGPETQDTAHQEGECT